MKSLFPRILVLFACIFWVPELSHAVEKWHNPEGPRRRCTLWESFHDVIARVKELNKLLSRTAREVGVSFADPGKVFLKGRKIGESLFVDGLHPNEAGYECIAPHYR